jgi:hypothetical protein
MATACMFRRRNRLTVGRHSGGTGRRAAATEGQRGAGGRARVGRARCHKRRKVASGRMGRTNPRTTTKGRAIAQNETRPRYRGQGCGGLVAPILMLHRQRDARYERPCALCERLRTLCARGCVLAPPIAVRWRVGKQSVAHV